MGTGQQNGEPQSDLWQYSPANDAWKPIEDFHGGKRWLMSVAELSNGKIYLGTGSDFLNLFNDWWEISCNDVSIKDKNNEIGCSLYPNPAKEWFSIELTDNLTNASLSVKNILGAEVKYQRSFTGNSITLQRDMLPEGLYFIIISQPRVKTITQKILLLD